MTEFRISVDLSGIVPPGAAFDAAHFPSLQAAVKLAAEHGRARWVAYASGAPLPGGGSVAGKHRKAYSASIELRQIGDFKAEVFSTYSRAQAIEDGEPPRDLKRMLDTSNKVRTFADGRRYLIIPFKWTSPGRNWTGGPNEMNHAVRGWWVGKTRTVAAPGQEAEWGTRFKRRDAVGLGMDPDTPGKDKNQVGMHAFRAPGARGGAASNATFKTFRTMADGQTGWVVPAIPPLRVAETTAQQVQEEAEQSFAAAAAEDLGRMMKAMGPRPGGGGAIRKIPGTRRPRRS